MSAHRGHFQTCLGQHHKAPARDALQGRTRRFPGRHRGRCAWRVLLANIQQAWQLCLRVHALHVQWVHSLPLLELSQFKHAWIAPQGNSVQLLQECHVLCADLEHTQLQ